MATKKAGGTSKNGRDSNSKNLGLKVSSLSKVNDRNILILGNKLNINPGIGAKYNKSYSIICNKKSGGYVKFLKLKHFKKNFILVV